MTEGESAMTVLATVLADPAAAKERLAQMNAAQTALANEREGLASEKKQYQKVVDDAQAQFTQATKLRQDAAADAAEAKQSKADAQALLDKVSNREAEIASRVAAADRREKDLDERNTAVGLKERAVAEREAAVAVVSAENVRLKQQLQSKLDALKAITG